MAVPLRVNTAFSTTSNWTSLPRFDRLLVILSTLSIALLYVINAAYGDTKPSYPPGSLPSDARGQGAGSCRMSFMSPSYLHLSGFGREFTRLGNGPWGLYLYREAGWDDDPIQEDGKGGETMVLKGTPVLFVPGNAGSFRQVRSLASAATRSFWELPGVKRRGSGTRPGAASLDFFTIDFNDDFSAFHGQTLFDQAEYTADCIRYILGLYAGQTSADPDPTSVIVVAHSMGGIVARAALLDPHYHTHSISTLITFATPHLVPPVTVDSGVDRVYSSINSYWREGYGISTPPSSLLPSRKSSVTPQEQLEDFVTVSISGGNSDDMIASEATSLSSLVPDNDSNGFTVFTTAIPGVQTPIDHLAILWCQQLMQVVAESILSIVDVRNSNGVVSRLDRIDELSTRLLGGLERQTRSEGKGRPILLKDLERGTPSRQLRLGERLSIKQESTLNERMTHLMPVPLSKTYTGPRRFSLLTSAAIGRKKEDLVEVYGCSNVEDSVELELSSCTPLFPHHVTTLPGSPHSTISPILPAAVDGDSMHLLTLDAQALSNLHHIAIIVKPGGTPWALAEFADEEDQIQVVDRGVFHLLLSGYKIEKFPSTAPSMISEVWLPALDTSLLALKVRVHRSACQESKPFFAPLLRQYSSKLHESKYYPNVRLASLYTHSSGPYLPPSTSPFASSGTRLQFFLDPTCQAGTGDLAIEIKVDLWRTIGSLVVRHRMAMVTVPFALIMLVIAIQIREFNSGHPFPPFGSALSTFTRRILPFLLTSLLVLSFIQSILLTNSIYSNEALADLPTARFTSPAPWLSDALLGNTGMFWSPFASILVFAILAVVVLEYVVLSFVVSLAAWAIRQVHARGSLRIKAVFSLDPNSTNLPPFQRLVSLASLLLLTTFFAPYQFAYLVLLLIHLFTTIRLLAHTQAETASALHQSGSQASTLASKKLWDQYHFAFSILFLLISLLPINALILVVWVRNLAVGWLAPFSSDHNILCIIGFLALVESVHAGKTIQRRDPSSSFSRLTTLLAFACAAYSLLYGIRSAHRIYTFANLFAAWLALLASGVLAFSDTHSKSVVPTPDPTIRKVATTTEG